MNSLCEGLCVQAELLYIDCHVPIWVPCGEPRDALSSTSESSRCVNEEENIVEAYPRVPTYLGR